MRFAKFKITRASGGRSTDESPPQQQQQRSYLQRVCSQIASFRGVNTDAASASETTEERKDPSQTTSSAQSIHDDDSMPPRPNSQIVEHVRTDGAPGSAPNGDAADPEGADAERKPTRHFPSWAETRSRLQQTSLLIRNACATKSSVLLSGVWLPYLRRAPRCQRVSLSSPPSGTTPPTPRHDDADMLADLRWLRAQLLSNAEVRESEISVRMSYFSSRSLSDPPAREVATRDEHRERASERESESESESDLFRRRCSSVDSYTSEYDSRVRSSKYFAKDAPRFDSDDDSDYDLHDERIRESLFIEGSDDGTYRVSLFRMSDGKVIAVRSMWI